MYDAVHEAITHTLEVEKRSKTIYHTITNAEDKMSDAATSTFHMLCRPFKIVFDIVVVAFVVALILGLGFVGNVLNKMKEKYPQRQRDNSRNNRDEQL